MANLIKLKRSAVAGRVPTSANLDLGELAINVRDGKLYFKRDDNTVQTILTTNAVINGDLNMDGDVTGSDVYIDGWGSISGSLANIQAGHFDATDVDTVYGSVRNAHNSTIFKGTPLAVVAGQTSGNVSDVVPADASDPALMPAVYIADEDILIGEDGTAIIYGRISGIDTSAFSSGDTVYVAPGGGWTSTKPVHPNKVQNLGIITKSHASNGGGEVMGAGRSNDVPNITPGKVLVGTATYPTESTAVHIDEANGNVGIGTTSPSHKLHVVNGSNTLLVTRDTGTEIRLGVGTGSPSHAIDLGTYTNGSIGGIKYLRLQDSQRIDGVNNRIVYKSDRGQFFYPISSNPSYDSYGVAIRHFRDSATNTNDDVLLVEKNDGTDLFKVKSSGNVGIGTTSPITKLEVSSSGANGIDISADAGNSLLSGRLFLSTGTTGQSVSMLNNTGDLTFRTQATPNNTSGNERMRIAANGNVGIGTTSPSYKLHVNGTSRIEGRITLAGNVNNYIDVTSGVLNIKTNDDFRIFKGLNTGLYYKGGTDRVGIGTTTPTARLDIAPGGAGSETIVMVGGTGNGNLKARHIEGKLHNSTANGILHLNYYADDDVSIVAGGGNVMVGAGVATEKLDVAGNIKSSGTVAAAGAITSNGVDVLDNAVAMAIALG